MSSKKQENFSDVVSLASQILDEMQVDFKVLQAPNSEYKAFIHVNRREVDAVKLEIHKRLPHIYMYEVLGDLLENDEGQAII